MPESALTRNSSRAMASEPRPYPNSFATMPFTLAHPAAVLPLKPLKWLPLIPLIIGSMVPDLAEYLPERFLTYVPSSHSRTGSLLLDLPFGLFLMLLLLLLQRPLTAPLWEPHRSFIRAAIRRFTAQPWWWLRSVPAVFIGTWTHLIWDSATHRDRWFVRHFPILQRPLAPEREHIWEVFHVLQYASSALGLLVLAAWYAYELRKSGFVGTGRIWRKCLLGGCVLVSLGIGVFVLSIQPGRETFPNYMIFSIVLECAMGSFAAIFLLSGLAITATEALRSRVAQPPTAPLGTSHGPRT